MTTRLSVPKYSILTDKHKAVGLYLEESSDDFLFLKTKGNETPIAVFNQSSATLQGIWDAVDKYMLEIDA